jgi:hypothetical protein
VIAARDDRELELRKESATVVHRVETIYSRRSESFERRLQEGYSRCVAQGRVD